MPNTRAISSGTGIICGLKKAAWSSSSSVPVVAIFKPEGNGEQRVQGGSRRQDHLKGTLRRVGGREMERISPDHPVNSIWSGRRIGSFRLFDQFETDRLVPPLHTCSLRGGVEQGLGNGPDQSGVGDGEVGSQQEHGHCTSRTPRRCETQWAIKKVVEDTTAPWASAHCVSAHAPATSARPSARLRGMRLDRKELARPFAARADISPSRLAPRRIIAAGLIRPRPRRFFDQSIPPPTPPASRDSPRPGAKLARVTEGVETRKQRGEQTVRAGRPVTHEPIAGPAPEEPVAGPAPERAVMRAEHRAERTPPRPPHRARILPEAARSRNRQDGGQPGRARVAHLSNRRHPRQESPSNCSCKASLPRVHALPRAVQPEAMNDYSACSCQRSSARPARRFAAMDSHCSDGRSVSRYRRPANFARRTPRRKHLYGRDRPGQAGWHRPVAPRARPSTA